MVVFGTLYAATEALFPTHALTSPAARQGRGCVGAVVQRVQATRADVQAQLLTLLPNEVRIPWKPEDLKK